MANRSPYTYTPGYNGSGRGYTQNNNSNNNAGRQAPRPQQGAPRPAQGQPRPNTYQGGAAQRPPQYGAPRQPGAPRQQMRYVAQPPPARPMKDLIMYAMILFITPLVGIVGVFFTPFLWVFAAVCIICAGVIWWQKCFGQGQRVIFSVVLVVLAVLGGITAQSLAPRQDTFQMMPGSEPLSSSSSSSGNEIDVFPQQSSNPALVGFSGVSATATPPINLSIDPNADSGVGTDLGGDLSGGNPEPTIAPVMAGLPIVDGVQSADPPQNPAVTGARNALENYLQQWSARDFEEMLKYTTESWRKAQSSPQQQLYWNHNWWILKTWTLSNETTSPTADSATFTVIADLNKSNSTQTPVKMEYKALVFKQDGTEEWYVDPDSLRSGVPVQETPVTQGEGDAQQSSEIPVSTEPTPEPTLSPKTKLWYNSKGGKRYHIEEKCSSIEEQYYKSMKSFTFEELDKSPYSKLTPCGTCNTPSK